MKDHHKMRAWDEENKCYWYLENNGWFCDDNDEGAPYIDAWEFGWEQESCTGMRDKNDKPYFTGDLYEDYKGRIHEVKPWNEMDDLNLFRNCCDGWKIIGNIHKNPELLK
jgi:hypothetical protein